MVTYEFSEGCLTVTCKGVFDMAMMEGISAEIQAREAAGDQINCRILDVRKLAEMDARFADVVRHGSRVYRRYDGRVPPTALVIKSETHRAFSIMWQSAMNQRSGAMINVQIFKSMEPARRWVLAQAVSTAAED